jgi:hypothetical protein
MKLNFESINYSFLKPDLMYSRISANDDIVLGIV